MTKRKVLILSFFLFCIFYSHAVMAESYFRPNVKIPGMENFFGELAQEDPLLSTTSSRAYQYLINESGIVRYVQAIYSYSAVLAGVIAMFMMVFAAYQWLMAGGNAEKIGRAKETISSTLLGLTLLFGGYLLLSQISDRLVILSPINIPDIPMELAPNSCETNADCAVIRGEQEVCLAKFYDPGADECVYSGRGARMTIKVCPGPEYFSFGGTMSDCYCGREETIGETQCVDYDSVSGAVPSL